MKEHKVSTFDLDYLSFLQEQIEVRPLDKEGYWPDARTGAEALTLSMCWNKYIETRFCKYPALDNLFYKSLWKKVSNYRKRC